jgi:hypothetical protein
MIKLILALVIVFAIVGGGFLGLRRSKLVGQPSQDVIDRAKIRERAIEAKERADEDS